MQHISDHITKLQDELRYVELLNCAHCCGCYLLLFIILLLLFLFLIIFIILLFNYSSEKVTCHTTHSLILSYSVTWPEMHLNISAM